MTLSIIYILLILVIGYWFAVQGLFSGLLHLAIVIAAGGVAFAVWEMIAYRLLGMENYAAKAAWGVGLLAPFAVFIMIARPVMDKLVGKNMYFPDIINKLAGFAVGVPIAILTLGVFTLGVGFLPMGKSWGGVQPYVVNEQGRLDFNYDENKKATGGLMVPVDRWAASFFTALSGGPFSSGKPISLYAPDLAKEAVAFRQTIHEETSKVTSPKGVKITGFYEFSADFGLPDDVYDALADVYAQELDAVEAGKKTHYAVVTEWKLVPQAADKGLLFLTPVQLAMIGEDPENEGAGKIFRPIGLSMKESRAKDAPLYFIPNVSGAAGVFPNRDDIEIVIHFFADSNLDPRFIRLRNIRFDAPKPEYIEPPKETTRRDVDFEGSFENTVFVAMQDDADEPDGDGDDAKDDEPFDPVRDLIGQIKKEDAAGDNGNDDDSNGQQHNAADWKNQGITETTRLPYPVNKTAATALSYAGEENRIVSGASATTRPPSLSKKVTAEYLDVPDQFACIQLKVDKETANTAWGRAFVNANNLNPIYLTTNFGSDKIYPFAYVQVKSRKGEQYLSVLADSEFTSAAQLPLKEMRADHELYLYFKVPREPGLKITGYAIGQRFDRQFDPAFIVNENPPDKDNRRR